MAYSKKRCEQCGQTKSLTRFSLDLSCRDGYSSQCKVCCAKKSEEWKRNNKEKMAGYRRKKKYGITPEQFKDMYDNQDGKCKICGGQLANGTRNCCVDHCHITGEVRGLLCSHCNRGLGLFRDNSSFLIRAADYLDSSRYNPIDGWYGIQEGLQRPDYCYEI